MPSGQEKIKIYSIFRSINGEIGPAGQGSWATFIRFAGCNLRCDWCDTEYAQEYDSGNEWVVEEIMQKVHDNRCRYVTITGGEPLMQSKGLFDLIKKLLLHNFEVSVETNGSMPIITRTHFHAGKPLHWIVDYKLPSSEHSHHMGEFRPWSQLTPRDYIKFVIANRKDYDVAVAKVQQFWFEGVHPQMVFSPIVGSPAMSQIFKWMQENQLFSVLVSVQLHKLIDLDEPK